METREKDVANLEIEKQKLKVTWRGAGQRVRPRRAWSGFNFAASHHCALSCTKDLSYTSQC